jgi:hypothetical protein
MAAAQSVTAGSGLTGYRVARARRFDTFPAWLLLPACLGLLLVDGFPFLYAIALSFQERIQGQPVDPWIGLANYRTVMGDAEFWARAARHHPVDVGFGDRTVCWWARRWPC